MDASLRRLLALNTSVSLMALAVSAFAVALHRSPPSAARARQTSELQPDLLRTHATLSVGFALEKAAAAAAGPSPSTSTSQHAADATFNGALTLALAEGSIRAFHVAADAIGPSELADAAVTGPKLAPLAVGAANLQDACVSAAKLSVGAVTDGKIAPGAVATEALRDSAVTGAKLANGAVGSRQLNKYSVDAVALADGAVTGAKLADGAVDGTKLARGAVSGTHLSRGAVTDDKLATSAVLEAHLADAAVGTRHLQPSAVDSARIADGTVGASDVDRTQVQLRVAGTCRAGTFVAAIGETGGVSCGALGLRTVDVYGTLDEKAQVVRGLGFSASRGESAGIVRLLYDRPFAHAPVTIVTPLVDGGLCSAGATSDGSAALVRCQRKTYRGTWEYEAVPFSFASIAV
ncbi:hypothetical protein KFE25_010569 [Diacronema lutheri]|uniref:Uncharacterized protein n=1 Tax=Diacronema lutheri TaxID=2081491 RepID=A0A8J5XCZ7_DIALT|nr:hypothetical protein KFE25_010569 [Diacronema lutheri]